LRQNLEFLSFAVTETNLRLSERIRFERKARNYSPTQHEQACRVIPIPSHNVPNEIEGFFRLART